MGQHFQDTDGRKCRAQKSAARGSSTCCSPLVSPLAQLSSFRTVLTYNIELCNWRQLSSLSQGQNGILTCILVQSTLLTHINFHVSEKNPVLRLNNASPSKLSCSIVLPCIVSFDCKICRVQRSKQSKKWLNSHRHVGEIKKLRTV